MGTYIAFFRAGEGRRGKELATLPHHAVTLCLSDKAHPLRYNIKYGIPLFTYTWTKVNHYDILPIPSNTWWMNEHLKYTFSFFRFEALVEREWIQAGHPFASRCSKSAFSQGKHKYAGPVFLLFIDCVWQVIVLNISIMVRSYPCDTHVIPLWYPCDALVIPIIWYPLWLENIMFLDDRQTHDSDDIALCPCS